MTPFEDQVHDALSRGIYRFKERLDDSSPLTLSEYLAPRVAAAIQGAGIRGALCCGPEHDGDHGDHVQHEALRALRGETGTDASGPHGVGFV